MMKNCHRHLWLLTGTGEGPEFAASLSRKGWRVTVSVVSEKAAIPYLDFDLESLLVGDLGGYLGIRRVLENAYQKHNGFDWVIDATHPFATLITSSLEKVCRELSQPLLRFERPILKVTNASLIKNVEDLSNYDLTGQSMLIALGARHLKAAINSVEKSGATAYARILPSSQSLKTALASSIQEDHLAPLRPFESLSAGYKYEAALCRRWNINNVLCRQSGGLIEKMWQKLCSDLGIDLWLIARPTYNKNLEIANSFEGILKCLEK